MLNERTKNRLLKTGNWMLRNDNDGKSYGGFRWKPKGQWTIAPDWNDKPECGGGLHGQSPKGHGAAQHGTRLVLCETDAIQIPIDGDKIKTPRAKIVAVNGGIPPEFLAIGSLDLRGCDLKGITLPQSVGGSLDLRGCDLEGITLPQSIGGWLDLSGCDLKGITIPKRFKGKVIR